VLPVSLKPTLTKERKEYEQRSFFTRGEKNASGSLALLFKDMTWNKEHINKVEYPDHPDLEQSLGNFRQQFSWYQQQLKYRKTSGIDTNPVETAWASFLRLRKKYFSY